MIKIVFLDIIPLFGMEEFLAAAACALTIISIVITVVSAEKFKMIVLFCSIVLAFGAIGTSYLAITKIRGEKREKVYILRQTEQQRREAKSEINLLQSKLDDLQADMDRQSRQWTDAEQKTQMFRQLSNNPVAEVSLDVNRANPRNYLGKESQFFGNTFATFPKAEALITISSYDQYIKLKYRRGEGVQYFEHIRSQDGSAEYVPHVNYDLFETNSQRAKFRYQLLNSRDSSMAPVTAGMIFDRISVAPFACQLKITNLSNKKNELRSLEREIRRNFAKTRIYITPNLPFHFSFFVELMVDESRSGISGNSIILTWVINGDPVKQNESYLAQR